MAHKCVFILATLASSGVFAGPLNSWTGDAVAATCATSCPVSTRFSFEPGQTYEYRYETDVQTTMTGASQEQSSLHMRSTVQLEVLSRCELSLKLSDVSLQDADPSQYESRQHVERAPEFKAALQRNDLRFAFLDGQVENICPQQAEATWVLNIKRGILSTLQNSMDNLNADKRVFEKDVAGNCPTEYEAQGTTWSTTKVKKTKDLLGCLSRYGPYSIFQGTPFTAESDIQSLPLMKGTHECEQQINGDGILTQSECSESHVFRPFSRHDSGAQTLVTTKLTFYRQFAGVTTSEGPVRSQMSLVYDHTLTDEEHAENLRDAKSSLRELCTESSEDIRPEVPALFTKFIRQARRLNTDDFSRLFLQTRNGVCDKAEKFFRDAIPMIGTASSVNLIRDLIERNKATDLEAEIWLTSISTSITRPTKDMINALKPLLNSEPSRKIYLAVSSLVNNYCRINSDCDTDTEVQEIVRIFEEHLHYNCRVENEEQHEEVLMTLKALGNTGHAESAVPDLVRCASNLETSIELRVAALQAFRNMPCLVERPGLFQILEDSNLDAEVRINAYLTLMACADLSTINRMRNILARETVNQVGSFIWTHLTNLMETSNPHKQDIRAILETEELQNEFNMDKRKFSRNIEWSLFSELLNMGGSAESNLIFSQDSYIPRSAMVNLTVNMFGQSVNLLELGTRMQGLEQLMERLFGPGSEAHNAVHRPKRAVINDDVIKSLHNTYNAQRDDPQISYFLRLCGNEIRYGDLHNFDVSGLQDKLNYLEWLINLADDHNFEVSKSIMFLDASHTFPTISGMPLKLEADGSASVNVKVNGTMDIRRMFTSPSHVDIHGSVQPSAALEVTSQMGVDAFVARTGLKMVTTLHTSTVLQGKIQLQDGRILNLDLDVPRDQMEIISAQSKFYLTWREGDREQNMLTSNQAESARCVGGMFTNVFGLELCGELSYPYDPTQTDAPFFPFTGPVKATLLLNKRDTYTGFHFEAKYIQDKVRTGDTVQITDHAKIKFNTPESQINRELSMEFNLDRTNKAMSFNLNTPWKRVNITGSIATNGDTKSWIGRALIDESHEYSVTTQLQTLARGSTLRYIPSVVVVIPNRRNVRLDGVVIMKQNRKYEMDVSLRNLFQQPVNVKGTLDKLDNRRRMKRGVRLEFSSSLLQATVQGYIDNNTANGNTLATSLQLEYVYANGNQQSIRFSHKMRNQTTADRAVYSLDSTWSTTMLPRYNGEVDLDFSMGNGVMRTSLEAGFDNRRKITITQTGNYNITNSLAVTGEARFQLPANDLDYGVSVNHVHNTSQLNSRATLRYDENNEATLNVALGRESYKPLKLSGAVSLNYPGREIGWRQSIDEQTPGEYHHDLNIQLSKYENIQLTSVLNLGSSPHELTATLTIPSMAPFTFTGHLRPEGKNFHADAALTAFEETYSTRHSHSLRSAGRSFFNYEMETAISWPGRAQIRSRSTYILRDNIFTTHMENSWAEGVLASLDGQLTLLKASPAMTLRVTLPENRMVNMALRGAINRQGWYNTEDDLQASMELTSTFPGYEHITANVAHDITTTTLLTRAGLHWAQGKNMTMQFALNKLNGYSHIGSILEMTTPFNNFRTIRGELNYNLEEDTFSTTALAQWEENQINLNAEGTVRMEPSRRLRGAFTLTTPFEGYERITATSLHTDDGSRFATEIQADWAPGRQINTQLTMRHQYTTTKITNSGSVSLETPFDMMRQGRVEWNHEHTDKKVNTRIDLRKDEETISLSVDAAHKANNYRRTLKLKTILLTPFENYTNLRMDISHQHGRRNWQNIKSDATFQWSQQTIAYEQEIDITEQQAVIKATLATPFAHNVSIDFTNEMQTTGFTMQNEVLYGIGQKVSLEGTGTVNEDNGRMTLHWTSPFPHVEEIIYNTNFAFEDGLHTAHKELQYATEKRIIIDGTLGMEDTKTGSLRFRSPCPYLNDVSLSTSFTGNHRTFHSLTELEHDLLPSRISLNLNANTADLENITCEVEFRSPFENVSLVRSTLSHSRDDRGQIRNTATLQMPAYQGSITNEMSIQSWNQHTTETHLEYTTGKRIELFTELGIDSTITGAISISTPWEKLKNLALRMSHEGTTLSRFQDEVNVDYNGISMSAETSFTLADNSITASANLETPIPGVQTINVELNHNWNTANFDNSLSINFAGNQIRSSSEFALTTNGPTGSMQITTPYEEMSQLRLTFAHNHRNWSDFDNTASFTFNDHHFTGNSEFTWNEQLFKGNFVVNIPHEYSVRLNHKGNSTNFSNTLTVKMADERVVGSSSFAIGNGAFQTRASVQTTFAEYENFEIQATHSGELTSFETTGRLITPFSWMNRQSFELTYGGHWNEFECTLNLVTPLQAMPTAAFTLSHEGSLQSFTSQASAQYSGHNINGAVSFTAAETIEGRATLTTSHDGLENFLISFFHTGAASNFRTGAVIETPFEQYQRMSVTYNHNGNWDQFTCEGSVETSYPGLASIQLEISNSIPSNTSIVSSLALSSSHPEYPRFAVSINHNGDWREMRSSGSVHTPFTVFPSGSYNIEHDMSNLRRIRSHSQVATSMGNFNLDVDHTGNRKRFTTEIALTSPFENYKSFAFTITQRARVITDITSNLNAFTPFGNYTFSLRQDGNWKRFQTEIEVTSTHELHERYALNIEHEGRSLYNINSMSLLTIPMGEFQYHLIHRLTANNMQSSLEITAPIEGYNRYRVNMDYTAPSSADIQSNGQIITPHGNASYTFIHTGLLNNMRNNLEIRTPFASYERLGFVLVHNSEDITNIESSATMSSPRGAIGYEIRHSGDLSNMQNTFRITTPFTGYESMGGNFQLSYTDKTNMRSNAGLTIPLGTFSYEFTCSGTLENLRSSIQLNSPQTETFLANVELAYANWHNMGSTIGITSPYGEFTFSFTNRGELTNMLSVAEIRTPFTGFEVFSLNSEQRLVSPSLFNSSVRVGTPIGEFTYAINHNGHPLNMRSSLHIGTPFTSFQEFGANVVNNIESWTSITSRATINTPAGEFSYSLDHNGELKNMESSLEVATPFQNFQRMTLSINNDIESLTRFQSTARLTIPMGQFSYNIDHRGDHNEMTHVIEVTTPFSGYNRLGANINHEMQLWRRIRSNGVIDTPVGQFGFNLDHNGDHNQLSHTAEITTPFAHFQRFRSEVEHTAESLTNIRSSVNFITPHGRFTCSLTHNGGLKTMRSNFELTTPYTNYERFTGRIENNIESYTNFRSEADVTAPFGNLGYNINHNGDLNAMSNNLALSTSYYGDINLSLRMENNIVSATNFASSATVGTPYGEFGYNINHRGLLHDMTSQLEVTTPFAGYERFRLNVDNNIQSWTNIGSEGSLDTPVGLYTYNLNHNGNYNNLDCRFTITTPHINMERITGRIQTNIVSWSNIQGTATVGIPLGELRYATNHQYENARLTHTTELTTPFEGYERFAANINYEAEATNSINSNARLNTPFGDVTYNVEHSGNLRAMQTSAELQIPVPGYERYAFVINHDAQDPTNIRSNTQMTTPLGNVGYDLTHTGNRMAFRTELVITTPVTGYERLTGSIEHNCEGNIETTARLNTPSQVFTASFNHEGSLQNFRTSFNMLTPIVGYERYSFSLENNCEDITNINTNTRLTLPYGEFSLGFTHTGDRESFRTALTLTTPVSRFDRIELVVEHSAADLSNIVTSTTLTTPAGRYGYSLTHEGGLQRFTSNAVVTTPFENYKRMEANIEHNSQSAERILSSAQLTTPGGLYRLNVDHDGSQRNIVSRVDVSTPIGGYERFGLTFTHTGFELTSINSGMQFTTPTGAYGYSLTHEGTARNFNTAFELNTPFEKFDRFQITVMLNAENLNDMRSNAQLETPIGSFGYSITHEGDRNAFTTTAQVSTPFTPYNSFSGTVNFNNGDDAATATTTITTSVPTYERIMTTVRFERSSNSYRLSGEHQTSMYGNLEFVVEISGDQTNPRFSMTLQTPFQGYENMGITSESTITSRRVQTRLGVQSPLGAFGVSYTHRGTADNFEAQGTIETPIAGYERFAFEIDHSNTRRLRTTLQIDTPIEGYNRFSMRLIHGANGQNMRSSLTLNTPIAGYEQFSALMTHQLDDGTYNTEVRVNTPIESWNTFALSMTHTGNLQNFQTSGTLNTPFEEISEIGFHINHQGTLRNFETTASFEYNAERVEGEVSFTTAAANYEGHFRMTSSCPWLRDIQVNGAHNKNGATTNGNFGVVHNGDQKVDFDYTYTTSGPQNLHIELRRPYPVATEINLAGQRNDASFNWDTTTPDSNARLEFNLVNEPEEKEVTLRLNLPRRLVGFSVAMASTPERFTHSAEVIWDRVTDSRASYQVEMSKTSRRRQDIYDGQVSVTSPLGNFVSAFNHRTTPGVQYTSEITWQQMRLRVDMTKRGLTNVHTLTLTHPLLPANTQLLVESTLTDAAVEGKIELSYNAHVITYTGRVADESSGDITLYTARTQLTHPSSSLDFQWNGELRDDSTMRQAMMEASYLTSYDSERKTASLRTQLQKQSNEFAVELVTPIKSLSIRGQEVTHDSSQEIHAFELTCTCDENQIRGEIEINGAQKSLNMLASLDEDNYIQAFAGLRSTTEVVLDVFRMSNDVKHQEILASISLSGDQLVSTRFFLCPNFKNELTVMYNNLKNSNTVRDMHSQITTAVNNELELKYVLWTAALEPFVPAMDAIKQQARVLFEQLKSGFNQMYEENQFYTKTICDALTQASLQLGRILRYPVDKIREHYASLYGNWAKLSTFMRRMWTAMNTSVFQFLTNLAQYLEHYRPYFSNILLTARNSIIAIVDKLQHCRTFQWAWNTFRNLNIDDLFRSIAVARNYILTNYQSVVERIQAMWDAANTYPQMRYIKAHVIRVYRKSKFALQYAELIERVKHILYELHEINLDTYRADLVERLRNYLQLERTQWTVWNPEEGEIGFDLYWPFHWDDLKHLPRIQNIDLNRYVTEARDYLMQYMPRPEFNIYDIYYTYKPSSDVFNWVPPFKTRAAIVGDQHYMTFDRRFYEFAGECSYLLAHDFIDGEFSVVVNYRNRDGQATRRSITAFINDKQVEVLPDARVIVDGTRVEMPYTYRNTTIMHMGSALRIDSTNGVTIDCNLVHDRCTVNVTGWYFGKTAGMFGTYNNEPVDDFKTSDNTIVNNAASLASSWTAGRECSVQNRAREVIPDPSSEHYRRCANLLQLSSSNLRPCFKVINPARFMTMCLNNIPVDREATEQDTCQAAAFYVDECRREEVSVRMPRSCVKCQIDTLDQEITEGQNVTLSGDNVPQSADVVFVIQHADCNNDTLTMIRGSMDSMNDALRARDLTNNRFAIVGYGADGKLNEPHVHTMDGNIFSTHDKILLGLRNFQRQAAPGADALAALRYAARLPFRAGVSKSIVLLPCSGCTEMSVSYGEIHQSLKKLSTKVHVLMQHNFELSRDKDVTSAFIFGADSERVYTRTDANNNAELEGNQGLRRQLQVPKNLCAAMAMETNGSVFNTLQWSEARPYMQKRFVDVLVRLIAKRAIPEDCQKCDCVADENGVGRTVCQTCQSTRSFFSFLTGFGESAEVSDNAVVVDVAAVPELDFEENTTPNPRQLRMLRRRNRKNRKRRPID